MKAGSVITTTFFLLHCLLVLSEDIDLDGNHLHFGFYNKTCPQVETITRLVVAQAVNKNAGVAAGLIRLHFHDCFVNGCDASILLDATPSGEPVEKEATGNYKSLRGLEVIDEIKARVEQFCPGIVSCADILAFAARDAAVIVGLIPYKVPAGRRDGRSSRAADAATELPKPTATVDELTKLFARKGLSQEEMVTLSGAHSIGVAHCPTFAYRLYKYSPTVLQDPSLDYIFASYLKVSCPMPGTFMADYFSEATIPFDQASPTTLDNKYYLGLKLGRGLLESDQALMKDRNTSKIVEEFSLNPTSWSQKFGRAMTRMGRIEVLTGNLGEIRNYCRLVN
ncbi:PREDICTED: peroxidase 5-like [Nelumbo nucifera]|uniref:Peroxidase n=2 Tax=Nelumbo nucifera TaxID=4432 RepID=A0A1U7ZC30_NELNU|nr:PREDICTED: peroxidase 5-like [Nelumbo nucifera]DAD34486.1 TPA_asm: hypothetical protein HUJ06_005126 [Nelumbo nucifera]